MILCVVVNMYFLNVVVSVIDIDYDWYDDDDDDDDDDDEVNLKIILSLHVELIIKKIRLA